jgi:CrcB protein
MDKIVLVGSGGFIGSVLRYLAGGFVYRWRGNSAFPLETLLINVTGCLGIGLVAALAESRGVFSGATRAFLMIGLLGGFTTFSAFGYETFELMRDGQFGAAALSVAAQVVLGIAAVWLGHVAIRMVWGS